MSRDLTSAFPIRAELHCTVCSAAISNYVQWTNDGLCNGCAEAGPLSNEQIQEKRRQVQEQDRLALDSAEIRYSTSLYFSVEESEEKLLGLPKAAQHYYLVSMMLKRLRDGGFVCFFDYSGERRYLMTLLALEAIDAPETRGLLEAAEEVLFPGDSIPESMTERMQAMPTRPENRGEMDYEIAYDQLEMLDRAYTYVPENLDQLLTDFAAMHRLY